MNTNSSKYKTIQIPISEQNMRKLTDMVDYGGVPFMRTFMTTDGDDVNVVFVKAEESK